jgi:hypothetical protein
VVPFVLFKREDVASAPWFATCPSGRFFVNGGAALSALHATRDDLCQLPAAHALFLEPIRGAAPAGMSTAQLDDWSVPPGFYDPPR